MDEMTPYTKARYRLWRHFEDEHGLTLVESDLDDILTEVEIYQKAINAEAGRIAGQKEDV